MCNNYGESNYFEDAKPKNKVRSGALALALCCSIAGGVVGAGAVIMTYDGTDSEPVSAITEAATTTVSTLSSVSGSELSPAQLYAENVDACVGITVSNVSTNAFGQVSTTASSGSGFVITSDGYIVTNYHVIADAASSSAISITVTFDDDTSYDATLVGYEEDNDVAVLKIDATDLEIITLGDSDQLEVGETVYAIGNPLGELTFSLTDGLVSALDRLISTDEDVTLNMFQTNTAINPGNSGGPVFNASGQVIGIATAKYSTSSSGTSVEGLGFAIPINDVVNMISDLMEYGYVTGKPYMGVQIVNAAYYGGTAGAGISYIAEDGAAEDAGLEVGDIITALDDVAIDTSSALTAAMNVYSAGDSAVITFIRDGATKTTTIVFDEKNTETEAANQITVEESTVQTPSTQTIPQMPSQNIR